MKFAIFGLTISSSWGNGQAALWRSLCRALAARRHQLVFFERDVPPYAQTRDLHELPGLDLRLYPDWSAVATPAEAVCDEADVAIVTSRCPDGVVAANLVLSSRAALKVFYDLDTSLTLGNPQREPAACLGPRGLADFDLVLSVTGGAALERLRERLGARRVAALYGGVDPDVHRPTRGLPPYAADLSFLGTYAEDRHAALEELLVRPARYLPAQRFVIAGARYPVNFPWAPNIHYVSHLSPREHAAFYSSSRVTLNVTRPATAALGHCPSVRLFEAAACGTPIVSDAWKGLDAFFQPGEEILVVRDAADVLDVLRSSHRQLERVGRRARERALDQYTSAQRARELEQLCSAALPTSVTGLLSPVLTVPVSQKV